MVLDMTPVLERLPDELEHQRSGPVQVLGVDIRVQPDSEGRDAAFIVVTLSDPPAGEETWPTEDIWRLRRRVGRAIRHLDPEVSLPWFLQLQTADPDDHGDDETVVELDGDSE